MYDCQALSAKLELGVSGEGMDRWVDAWQYPGKLRVYAGISRTKSEEHGMILISCFVFLFILTPAFCLHAYAWSFLI